jgi:hypothetical protein
VIEVLGRHNRTFHQSVHPQAGFLIYTRVTYVNSWVTYGELEILAYVGVQAHNIAILHRLLSHTNLVVKSHGFDSTPVQSVACEEGLVSHHRMSEQFWR